MNRTTMVIAAILVLAIAPCLGARDNVKAIAPVTAVKTAPAAVDQISIPHLLNYQGRLTDTLGRMVRDSIYPVTFRLYKLSSGGVPFWSEARSVSTHGGLFNCLLGLVTPVESLPSGGACYLEMQFDPEPAMTPRIRIVSSAYSFFARKADTANVALTGADNVWVRGTPDSVLFTVRELGIARGGAGNALLGGYPQSHLNLGVQCTTGTSGGSQYYCTALGYKNTVTGNGSAAVVGGQYNRSAGYAAAIAGGYFNTVSGEAGFVGAGRSDTVLAYCGAILGGLDNEAGNEVGDTGAVVVGGAHNRVVNKFGFVGGGSNNSSEGRWSTISGGSSNRAANFYSTIGGGYGNFTNDYYAAITGGFCDSAIGNSSTVTGGAQNYVQGDYSTILGGSNNKTWGTYSLAFGQGVNHGLPYSVTLFEDVHYGNLLINRNGLTDGHILDVGTQPLNGNGAYLWSTGIWTDVARRSDWKATRPIDGGELLGRIAGLDIGRREFDGAGGVCVTPDGDEFNATFGCKPGGSVPTRGALSPLDVAGVSLAGVQELARQMSAMQAEINELKAELAKLRK